MSQTDLSEPESKAAKNNRNRQAIVAAMFTPLDKGIAAKRAGQALVESHNESFVEVMRAEARRRCAADGTVTSDDLREYAEIAGLRPRHRNAFGAIFLGKEWRAVGYTKSRLVSNHARTIRIWQLA